MDPTFLDIDQYSVSHPLYIDTLKTASIMEQGKYQRLKADETREPAIQLTTLELLGDYEYVNNLCGLALSPISSTNILIRRIKYDPKLTWSKIEPEEA